MAELKPCPFCGEIGTSLLEGSTYRWAVMACSHCEARAPEVRKERIGPGFCDQDEIDAREEWNRRPSVPPVGEREFRLAEAVVYLLGDLHEVKDDKPDGWADSIVAEARAILSSPAPDPASEPRAIECRSTCARAGCQNLRPHWCSSCGEVDNWEDHYKFHGYCSDDCRAADEAPPFGAVR